MLKLYIITFMKDFKEQNHKFSIKYAVIILRNEI
jgi:hypothetical protein